MVEEKKKTNSRANTKKSTSSTNKKTTKVVKEVKKTKNDKEKELEKEIKILKEELESVEKPEHEIVIREDYEIVEQPKNEIVAKEDDEKPLVEKEKSSGEKENGKFTAGEVIIVMILALILGLVLGGFVVSTRMLVKDYANGKRIKSANDINMVYDSILSEYYGKEIEKGKVVDNGIYGLLSSLEDRYSEYVPAKNTKDYDEYMNGDFVGIGVEIYQEELNSPVITKVFPGGPSDKAGIKVNDVLLRVNGEEVQGREMSEITSKIKVNRPGTKLNVVVLRDDKELSFDLNREKVIQPTIYVEYEEKTATVRIDNFTKHTAEEFKKVYEEIKEKGTKSLILDLRNNNGGYVESAKEVAEMFLDKNAVIYKVESKKGIEDVKSTTKKEITLDTVVVVNESTALGSEILATSLRENLGFKVIGQKTYGYGVLRKQFVLSDGSYVLIPNSKWLTKEGTSIDNIGIEPDEVVEDSKVLERAKELLNNKI